MRSILIAVGCLVFGVLGALGYSHYLGEGKQLADLQDELTTTKASLAKAGDDAKQAKSETDAMSAQIQQLTATRDDLKKQLETAQSSAPATPAASTNPFANLGGMMKTIMANQSDSRFQLLKARLHLRPDQEATLKAAMDHEAQRNADMAAKLQAGGKIDPQAMAADLKNFKTVEQTLNDILDPDQKTAYQQMKTDEKNSNAETIATIQLNQLAPMVQLTDTQKDQAYNALAQAQLQTQDPAWVKANVNAADPTSILDAQAKAKEDALAKILTPDQLAIYQQQTQSQLDMQKAMMQKMMPKTSGGITVGSETVVAPAPAPSAPPTPANP
jgi:chromosome segregation ATPase